MKHVYAIDMNSVLWEKGVTNPSIYNDKNLVLDLGEFVGSQILNKIVDFDYRLLIKTSVTLNNLSNNKTEMTDLDMENIKTMYTMFMNLVGLVGLKLYLLYKVKLYMSIPDKMYNKGVELKGGVYREDCLNIVRDFKEDVTINEIWEVFKKESVMIGTSEVDMNKLDYSYLSKVYQYYRMSKAGIMVVESR